MIEHIAIINKKIEEEEEKKKMERLKNPLLF